MVLLLIALLFLLVFGMLLMSLVVLLFVLLVLLWLHLLFLALVIMPVLFVSAALLHLPFYCSVCVWVCVFFAFFLCYCLR